MKNAYLAASEPAINLCCWTVKLDLPSESVAAIDVRTASLDETRVFAQPQVPTHIPSVTSTTASNARIGVAVEGLEVMGHSSGKCAFLYASQ